MATVDYFDYVSVADEAGIAPEQLAALEERARPDYPGDQMMFELRMLRTCNAIRRGKVSVESVLRSKPDDATEDVRFRIAA